ncbi:hypothetical protein ASF33_20210 [Methylobacterium sp. Leaf92]|nr:hypothetical protein ASF33_20210 [Methylobacterium sp. Leaf92]
MAAYGEGETIKRGWIIVHEPGLIPALKIPHPQTDDSLDVMLEALTKNYPKNTKFTVACLTWNEDLWIEDGAERLAINAAMDSLTLKDWAEIDAMCEEADRG